MKHGDKDKNGAVNGKDGEQTAIFLEVAGVRAVVKHADQEEHTRGAQAVLNICSTAPFTQ